MEVKNLDKPLSALVIAKAMSPNSLSGESILTNSCLCQILSLNQGTKNHVWVLNEQRSSCSRFILQTCFLQQFHQQTTKRGYVNVCFVTKIPSKNYLKAVAIYITTSFIVCSMITHSSCHSAPTVNQPKDQLNQFSGH